MEFKRLLGLRSLAWAALFGASALGCSNRDITVQLQSLSKSDEMSFVCRGFDATGRPEGFPMSECLHATLGRTRNLLALITQPSTGEVAVVNVPPNPREPVRGEGVIDLDPATPGPGFLRVGAAPVDIVTTPNGEASFVSSADEGRPGLYALPTSCLSAPRPDQSIRDLTTWAACRLDSAPGSMELVFQEGTEDTACESKAPDSNASEDRECPASLQDPKGRWKLFVALPDAGSVVVVDAQRLLDREPGSFDECPIDRTYALAVDLPLEPISQRSDGESACISPVPTPPPPASFAPRPADLVLADDDVLYVADEGAPVVHRLDVSRACSATEMPPLLPVSHDNPARTVTTSKVSVSPLTPSGKRFLYAVDQEDVPSSSVMVFDVSPNSTDRTPLLRDGSAEIPGDSPDRLRFNAAVRDVQFIQREAPIPRSGMGSALAGLACNPSPDMDLPGTEYQSRIGVGSSPQDLRGVFAFVLLSNGVLSVVDVEDFDAPCRRPMTINRDANPDFRGCQSDSPQPSNLEEFRRSNGDPSVTNELSCRMVVPHRERSAFYGMNTSRGGVHGPSLRSFPQLTVPEGDLGTPFASRPKLLGVDFEGVKQGDDPVPPVPAEVYVGLNLFRRGSGSSSTELVVDPAVADRYSVTLPFIEPRAYTTDTQQLTYEGAVASGLTNAILSVDEDTLSVIDPANGGFCGLGVNDIELMRELGARRFELSGEALETFARTHADTFWITGEVPEEDDPYWRTGPACDRAACLSAYDEFDEDEPNLARRFQILDANDERMTLSGPGAELAACCFPPGAAYEIRATRQWLLSGSATGVRHDVIASPRTLPSGEQVFECVRDCDPSKRWNDPRVFEIACGSEDEPCNAALGVASSTPGEDPCQLDPAGNASGGFAVTLDEPAASCIHATPTARFAVYRGASGSRRGMTFSWDVSAAYQPLGIDLRAASTSVSPSVVRPLPSLDWLAILDSAALGLALVDVNGFRLLSPTIN